MNDFHHISSSGRHRYIGWLQSFQNFCPESVGSYCAVNLDTIPKVMNHALILLSTSNIFLLLGSLRISFVTLFAATLLTTQTVAVIMVMNHDNITFAPRVLEPTEFMVGLCLGICIGGIILAFFLSITFRRMFDFCRYAETAYEADDHEHACGSYTHRLWGIWLWSTIVFCLDLVVAILVAAGRSELSHTPQQEYRTIGQDYDTIGGIPSEQRPPQQQQQQQQQQQPQMYGNQFQQSSFQQQDPRIVSQDQQYRSSTGGYGDFPTPSGSLGNGGGGGGGAKIIPV